MTDNILIVNPKTKRLIKQNGKLHRKLYREGIIEIPIVSRRIEKSTQPAETQPQPIPESRPVEESFEVFRKRFRGRS